MRRESVHGSAHEAVGAALRGDEECLAWHSRTRRVEAGSLCGCVHRCEPQGCVAAEAVHLEVLGWPPFACGPGWLLQSILTWHGECALVGYGLERERCGSVGRRRL